jgi:hypothetical protein
MTAPPNTHGHARRGRSTPEFHSWCLMINRCRNASAPKYRYYGGRGIRVCEEWQGDDGFAAFLAHIGPRPGHGYSVDRFPDQNGDYRPGNVRWATMREQCRNRRNNRFVEIEGRRMTLAEAEEVTGVKQQTIGKWVRKGLDVRERIAILRAARAANSRVARGPGKAARGRSATAIHSGPALRLRF